MINLVIGRQGSCKTILLVKKAYEYYKTGKTIYSNVHLKFPYKKLNYNDIVNCKYENAVVILDEIHQLLSARNSMSRRNREICDSFLSMVRKKKLIIFGSTQTERKVDIRFREEIDFLYETEKYVVIKGKIKRVVQSREFDKSVTIITKVKILDTYSEKIIETAFIGNNYYDYFDTNQIIKIKGLEIDKEKKKKN